jgi:hypothetical protein
MFEFTKDGAPPPAVPIPAPTPPASSTRPDSATRAKGTAAAAAAAVTPTTLPMPSTSPPLPSTSPPALSPPAAAAAAASSSATSTTAARPVVATASSSTLSTSPAATVSPATPATGIVSTPPTTNGHTTGTSNSSSTGNVSSSGTAPKPVRPPSAIMNGTRPISAAATVTSPPATTTTLTSTQSNPSSNMPNNPNSNPNNNSNSNNSNAAPLAVPTTGARITSSPPSATTTLLSTAPSTSATRQPLRTFQGSSNTGPAAVAVMALPTPAVVIAARSQSPLPPHPSSPIPARPPSSLGSRPITAVYRPGATDSNTNNTIVNGRAEPVQLDGDGDPLPLRPSTAIRRPGTSAGDYPPSATSPRGRGKLALALGDDDVDNDEKDMEGGSPRAPKFGGAPLALDSPPEAPDAPRHHQHQTFPQLLTGLQPLLTDLMTPQLGTGPGMQRHSYAPTRKPKMWGRTVDDDNTNNDETTVPRPTSSAGMNAPSAGPPSTPRRKAAPSWDTAPTREQRMAAAEAAELATKRLMDEAKANHQSSIRSPLTGGRTIPPSVLSSPGTSAHTSPVLAPTTLPPSAPTAMSAAKPPIVPTLASASLLDEQERAQSQPHPGPRSARRGAITNGVSSAFGFMPATTPPVGMSSSPPTTTSSIVVASSPPTTTTTIGSGYTVPPPRSAGATSSGMTSSPYVPPTRLLSSASSSDQPSNRHSMGSNDTLSVPSFSPKISIGRRPVSAGDSRTGAPPVVFGSLLESIVPLAEELVEKISVLDYQWRFCTAFTPHMPLLLPTDLAQDPNSPPPAAQRGRGATSGTAAATTSSSGTSVQQRAVASMQQFRYAVRLAAWLMSIAGGNTTSSSPAAAKGLAIPHQQMEDLLSPLSMTLESGFAPPSSMEQNKLRSDWYVTFYSTF